MKGQSGRTRLSAGPWLLLLLGCPTLVIVMTMGMILAMLKLFLPLHNIFVSTKMWYPPHWQQEGWRRPRGIPRRPLYKQPGNIFLSLNDPFSSRSTKTRQSIQSNSIQSSVQTCKIFGIEVSSLEREYWPNVNTLY